MARLSPPLFAIITMMKVPDMIRKPNTFPDASKNSLTKKFGKC